MMLSLALQCSKRSYLLPEELYVWSQNTVSTFFKRVQARSEHCLWYNPKCSWPNESKMLSLISLSGNSRTMLIGCRFHQSVFHDAPLLGRPKNLKLVWWLYAARSQNRGNKKALSFGSCWSVWFRKRMNGRLMVFCPF